MIDFPETGLGLKSVEALLGSIKAGRAPHAALISGPRGTGKRSVARFLAQALVCVGSDAPCGACPACRQFAENALPDVKLISTDARSIGVDEIRALRDYLSLRPFAASRHVAIIEQADKMTAAAQNALLKTLEEPSGGNAIFLVTDLPGAMLSTIVSRCVPVRLSPLPIGECVSLLVKKGFAPEKARAAARLSQGCPLRAEELDDAYFELEKTVLESLQALKKPLGVQEAAALLPASRDKAGDVLDIMEVTARGAMARRNGADSDSRADIDGKTLLMCVIEARKKLAGNVSWQAVVDGMYIKLTGGY